MLQQIIFFLYFVFFSMSFDLTESSGHKVKVWPSSFSFWFPFFFWSSTFSLWFLSSFWISGFSFWFLFLFSLWISDFFFGFVFLFEFPVFLFGFFFLMKFYFFSLVSFFFFLNFKFPFLSRVQVEVQSSNFMPSALKKVLFNWSGKNVNCVK